MAKFNQTTTSKVPNELNMEGFPSFSRDDARKELASIILNSMVNGDSFYETEDERFQNIEEKMKSLIKSDPTFASKAMVYARTEGNLRSISHFLAGILIENVKGTSFLKPALEKSFVRPDDMTEIVGLWNTRNPGKMIPNVLRKAIKEALETKFNMYQFKKYSMNSQKVKLSDLVKLSRPRPQVWFDNFG